MSRRHNDSRSGDPSSGDPSSGDPSSGDPSSGHSDGQPRELPADLAAVQADDALLDMLGSAYRAPDDTDDELVRLMLAWRREIHADSEQQLVDTDTALAVIGAARRPTRRRNPVFSTVAAAAAVLVIAFSALGLLAKTAVPSGPLWGVAEVLYPDYTRSVQAAASVRNQLDEAKTAIRQGKRDQAKASLQRIQQQLPVIAEAEGRHDLAAQHHDLEKMLVERPGAGKEGSSTGSTGSTGWPGWSGAGSPPASSTRVPPTTSSGSSSTTTTTEPNPLSGAEPTPQPRPTVTFTPPPKPTKPAIPTPDPKSSGASSAPPPRPDSGMAEQESSLNSSDSSGDDFSGRSFRG